MKLYRSQKDRKLFGLCGGLAEVMGIDSTWIRLLVIVTAVLTGGAVIFLYFLACMVIPKEPMHPAGIPPFDHPHYGDKNYGGANMNYGYNSGPYYGGQQGYAAPSWNAGHAPQYHSGPSAAPNGGHAAPASNLDEMFSGMEVKAMRKEIEELRAKLEKFETAAKE
ncbi:PspC domain-containing protein [Paenibacillus turpanensis]|uniref:PspC domain-containing protein n=1 Tax=Paenibacillus turpanensis TaxID=2689078 RepID=UPI001409EBD4|nr:PspC domain-containing protein [Paenibacillus turpanensis]